MTARVERVLIVVFDGLRPDRIAGRAPALEAWLAEEAVRFSGARTVFPSMTRVATSALATGRRPGAHGIVGNAFHPPALPHLRPLDTARREHLEALDALPGGALAAPGLGERLAAAGLRLGVVHGGSAGSAWLSNHRAGAGGAWTVSAHGAAFTRTPEAQARAEALAGPAPAPSEALPKAEAIAFAARAAEALALEGAGADVALVWLPEPDTSYHYAGIGSATADAALAAADAAFARLLAAARSGPRGDRTAVIALSDHGQITISGRFDLEAAMRADGLAAAFRPGPEDRLALTVGSSGEIRPLAPDPGLIPAAADWLMTRPEIGMVLARDDLAPGLAGTLPLSAVGLDGPRAPELAYVMRQEDGPDAAGLPGLTLVTGGPPTGGGMHGGLHPAELSTLLAVAAPGAAAGAVDPRPCGILDVAPTVLALLGLPAEGMDGAPLPLAADGAEGETETLEAARGAFRQRLTRRRGVDGRLALERGGRA